MITNETLWSNREVSFFVNIVSILYKDYILDLESILIYRKSRQWNMLCFYVVLVFFLLFLSPYLILFKILNFSHVTTFSVFFLLILFCFVKIYFLPVIFCKFQLPEDELKSPRRFFCSYLYFLSCFLLFKC